MSRDSWKVVAAGITDTPWGFNSLAAKVEAALQADLLTIQARLGHAQVATTHYGAADVELMRGSLDKAGVCVRVYPDAGKTLTWGSASFEVSVSPSLQLLTISLVNFSLFC